MTEFSGLRSLSAEIVSVLQSLDDARDACRQMRSSRDESAKKAKAGAELWRAASDLVRHTNVADFVKALGDFKQIVDRTGEDGLDPDAIPF